jgi:hypothetical protein
LELLLEVTSDSIIFIVIEVSNLDIDLVDYFELLLYICEWVSIKNTIYPMAIKIW